MKILNTINGSIRKFGKGMLAIFAIKLLFFGGAVVLQSCETESIGSQDKIEQNLAFSKFESLVQESIPKIRTLKERQEKELFLKGQRSESINKQNQEEMTVALQPLVDGSKELLSYFDYTESDLSEDFEDLNDPRISLIGLMLLSAQNQNINTTASNQELNLLFGSALYAASSTGKIRDCFLESTGIAAGVALVGALAAETIDKGLVKKLIKRAVKKIGGRVLGGIGLALIALDFTYCLATSE
jgi:hypothetical protein